MSSVDRFDLESDMGAIFEQAFLIRRTEEKLLELFDQGRLHGTVHTCVGQEMSAIAFAGQLNRADCVFSNHRCHGHHLAFSRGNVKGLLLELLGKQDGVCKGVGGSQHLKDGNFFSSGIQGGIAPLGAGLGLAQKLRKESNISVIFVGDGTFGEGVLYETLNIISLWDLPVLVVCENNSYAQSTPLSDNMAGSITERVRAFGIDVSSGDTWNWQRLVLDAREAINKVRKSGRAHFFYVETYRLNPHSKGDEIRCLDEVKEFTRLDPLNVFQRENPSQAKILKDKADSLIDQILSDSENLHEMTISEYAKGTETLSLSSAHEDNWVKFEPSNKRQVHRINEFFNTVLSESNKSIFLGEDVAAPYGGAFKVSKELSYRFPDQVFSTPISEQAIAGLANGLALAGFKPYLEIMFGDFVTLALDQLINHASKFHHMYGQQVECPIVIRTPMGGGRGYGPTHSQSLEKLLLGIDNIVLVALNAFVNPISVYDAVHATGSPCVVIENKLDYGRFDNMPASLPASYEVSCLEEDFPVIKIQPKTSNADVTVVTYGGSAYSVVEGLHELFEVHEILVEVLIITKLAPVDISVVVASVARTQILVTVEEGSAVGGFGSEIISTCNEVCSEKFVSHRIASVGVPIPSNPSLEREVLVNRQKIVCEIAGVVSS